MSTARQNNQLHLLDTLADFTRRLEAGSLEIGEFNTWFMSSEWETRMANNTSALRLGWDIQNILYEWQDFPDTIPSGRVVKNIRDAMNLYDIPTRTLATQRAC